IDYRSVLPPMGGMSGAEISEILGRALEQKVHAAGEGRDAGLVTTHDLLQQIDGYRRLREMVEKNRYGEYLLPRGGGDERGRRETTPEHGGRARRRPAVGDAPLARAVEQDALSSAARAADRAQRRPRALRARLAPPVPSARLRPGLVYPRGPVQDRGRDLRPRHHALLSRPTLRAAALHGDGRTHALLPVPGADDPGPPHLRRALQHEGTQAHLGGARRRLTSAAVARSVAGMVRSPLDALAHPDPRPVQGHRHHVGRLLRQLPHLL